MSINRRLINTGGVSVSCEQPFGDGSSVNLFRFNGNLNDDVSGAIITGNNIAGYLSGGYYNQSLLLTGSNSYVDCPTNMIDQYNDFTMMGYFRGVLGGGIFSFYTGGHDTLKTNSDGSGTFGLGGSFPAGTLSNNVWYHFAYVVDKASQISLYFNGSLAFTTANYTGDFGRPSTFGSQHSGASHVNFWNGELDQFRTFSRALSPSEVNYIYTSDAPCG